jgi:CubicO group peptidase (beta-lactamase class C family)
VSSNGGVARLLERAVAAGCAPSAVAAWGRAGTEPRFECVGRALIGAGGRHADPHTRYDLASLTKPLVTTTLFLLAARQGRVTLDMTVGEALDLDASSPPLARATLAELLSHTAGLPAWKPLYAIAGDPSEVADRVLRIELETAPGQRVVYTCLGFILLGIILERILEVPLDAAFQRLVAAPVGLADEIGFNPVPDDPNLAGGATTADPEPDMCSELGLPADRVPPVGPGRVNDGNARFLGGVAGNSGLFGTAAGVLRLACEYLAGQGRLLEAAEIHRATSIAAQRDGLVRGLGWQIATSRGCSAGAALGPRAFGHTGFTGTSLWVDPDSEAVYVLLTNRHHPGYHDVDLHPLRRRFHELAAQELSRR